MLSAKADSLVDKTLSFSRIRFSKSQTLKMDGVEIGVLLSVFAQQHRCKNADVRDINFILSDVAGISPTLNFNQNTEAKERGSCVPSKI